MAMKMNWMAAFAALCMAGCASAPQVGELLIVGDDITSCAPMTELGWEHSWGMAATAEKNDFAHRLHEKLRRESPDAKLTIDSIIYQDEMTGWVHLIPCRADLVVIQLSENYQGGVSPEEYGSAYRQLIRELRDGGPKTVVCVGPWKNVGLEPVIAQAAKDEGAIYVSLREIHADPANFASADGKFPKLGDMPGDRGMAAIADAVWKAIQR